jgi:hypothetical protein
LRRAHRGPALSTADLLDRALVVARRGGGTFLALSWGGGAAVATVVLGVVYLELVEGVRGMRPLLAMALVLAWWLRAAALSAAARRAVALQWPSLPLPAGGASPAGIAGTAAVVGWGLWLWLWLPVAASFISPVAVLLVLPALAVRGAVAPSWLARLGCEAHGGVSAFFHAMGDTRGVRASSLLAEALLLCGLLLIGANIQGLIVLAAALGRSVTGLDPTAVTLFFVDDNMFAGLTVGVFTLVLAEPLRAALSAVIYLEARLHREGLDLVAAVEAAEQVAPGRRSAARAASAVALLVAAGSLSVTPARGWADAPAVEDGHGLEDTAGTGDEAIRSAIDDILARSEFQDVEGVRSSSPRELLDRFFEWLGGLFDRDVPEPAMPNWLPSLPMPSTELLLVAAALLVAILLVYVAVQRRRDATGAEDTGGAGAADQADPRDQAPSDHLAEAVRLADAGHHREALRSLYLATLVAFDRRGLIAFDPTRTNWQYLRQLPPGGLRADFGSFTRLFDHKWYGDEPTTRDDFERGRALAAHLCASPEET